MILGIDASQANRKIRSGTEWYAFYLIEEFKKLIGERGDIEVRLYLRDEPQAGLAANLPDNFEFKILRWPFPYFWGQIRLSWEMLVHPPDVLFCPAHTIPLVHPHSPTPSLNPSPQGGGNGESKVEGNKAPPAVKVPSAKPVVPTAPKVNICEEAQKTRDQKYQQADAEYSTAHSAARQTFDAEQAQYETSLTALSRRRNDGINKYLTAIALATSKYNSSTEPNAYEIYQQEQSAALSAYTETTAGINTEESPILAAKKDSQTKYDAAVAAALAKRDGDKAAAEAEYATSTEGKSCKN